LRHTLRASERRFGLLSVSPTLLVILLVVLLPLIWTVLLSFRELRLFQLQRVNLISGFNTLDNYREILRDQYFWAGLRTTLVYSVVGSVGAIVLGLIAALSMAGAFRGRGLVRGLVLIPYVMPVVASTLLWRALLNPQYGLVNAVGERVLGWDAPVSFLSQKSVALPTVIAFEVWQTFPFCYLFLLARLQAIPKELTEAARIDGATPSQRFWFVVLPQLRGVLAVLLLLRFIWTFQSFNDIYLLTGGAGNTEVISIQVYNRLVNDGDVGGASALGMIMASIMAAGLFLYYRSSARAPRSFDA
jgi:multiple sugar transport system permease protein